jgi:hypothetical protein
LPSAGERALGKDSFLKDRIPAFAERHGTDTRQRHSLPSVTPWHSANLFLFFLPPNYFCSPPTLLGAPCKSLAHILDFLLYLFDLFDLIEFFSQKCEFELQVHRIMECNEWKMLFVLFSVV